MATEAKVPAAPVNKVKAKAMSQLAAQAAMNATSQSPWLSGLKFDTYTDVYDAATGELKTFFTSSSYTGTGATRKQKPADQCKIGGRIVRNSAGQEVKLYNGFIGLVSGINGVTAVDVKDSEAADAPVLGTFTSIEGAKFGIFAVETDENSNQELPADSPLRKSGQTHYKVIQHLLQATAATPKPTKAELAAA